MKLAHVFLLLLAPTLTGAEIYRWVDDDGVVNYTQQQPEGIPSERIVTRGASTVAVHEEPKLAVPKDPNANLSSQQQAMLKRLEEAEDARQAEIARIKQSNCDRAQAVLERLSSKGRIRVRDNDGNETAMPEEERQQRISEAQRDIVANCEATG